MATAEREALHETRAREHPTPGNASQFQTRTPHRIALFSGNYNYLRDGANLTLNRLVGFLERLNVAVRVYAPTVPDPAFAPTGTLISIPSVPLPRRKEYRLGLGLPPKVVADLAAFRPTLFHLSAPDLIGYSALRLARKWSLPVVASYHTRFESYLGYYGLSFLQPAVLAYLRHFYRQCEQLYAPTEGLAQMLRAHGFNNDIRIWSRGIDRARFNPMKRDDAWRGSLGLAPDDVVVTFVGRLVLEKGLNLLCETMGGLAATGVNHRLLIVGDGPERDMIRNRIPTAVFTGHLDGAALDRAYASSDIFFNPSTTESFGNVTLEAMASGLATVCAMATGSSSLVCHGVTGLLVAPERPRDFVSAIARLVSDELLRKQMGQAGRASSRDYDWDRVMTALLAHYGEVKTSQNAASRQTAIPAPASRSSLLMPQEQVR